MLFNSYEFIFLFLPIVYILYIYLNYKKLTRASKVLLVFSSLFFYSWWNIAYLPIILSSMIFNYIIGKTLSRTNISGINYRISKKYLLFFGVFSNLALLGYFKYTDFFIENFNIMFDTNMELFHLALPLAISFFTFQQISYLVDSTKGEVKEHDFLNYSLFVTFFPQLIAGPIVHHKEMMPQFESKWNIVKNYENIVLGIFIFSIGLFKKIVIADTFAIWATKGFDVSTTLTLFEAWATSLSYTFQLYFDFSGYADMAIGSALFFNIKLPINFNSPYKALTIQDFWKRWHITLSRFLKDYVYIPFGGNRNGTLKTYTNLMATFILGGIWHGAGWTFVFWGFLHGLALVIHKVWSNFGIKMYTFLAWIITFNFINIAWIFFRAKEWDDAIKVLSGMIGLNGIILPNPLMSKLGFLSEYGIKFGGWVSNVGTDGGRLLIPTLIIAFFLVLVFENSNHKLKTFKFDYKTIILSAFCFSFSVLSLTKVSEFLYFNF